jgi:hypothetical protein
MRLLTGRKTLKHLYLVKVYCCLWDLSSRRLNYVVVMVFAR